MASPDPLSILGTAFSSIFAAIRLAQFAIAIMDVPESAQTFVRLVERVEKDVEHALTCRIDCETVLDNCPSSYEEWISDSINDTMRALDDLGKVLLGETKKEALDLTKSNATLSKPLIPGQRHAVVVRDQLGERILWVLKDHAKLEDQERALSYSHSTLLTVISAMHTMIFHGGEARFGPGRVTRAASRPKYSSSQRPNTEHLDLLRKATDDGASPLSLPDPLSVGTGAVGLQIGACS